MLRRLIDQCPQSAPLDRTLKYMARPSSMRKSTGIEAIAAIQIPAGSNTVAQEDYQPARDAFLSAAQLLVSHLI